jgi:hypothetical protein
MTQPLIGHGSTMVRVGHGTLLMLLEWPVSELVDSLYLSIFWVGHTNIALILQAEDSLTRRYDRSSTLMTFLFLSYRFGIFF